MSGHNNRDSLGAKYIIDCDRSKDKEVKLILG